MADPDDIPSLDSVLADLRVIVRDGAQRFSMESLKTLARFESLRPQSGEVANLLSVKSALFRHTLHLRPLWKRDSALALFGFTKDTDSVDLPGRREVAGQLWNPPVSGATFRARGKGESCILDELAASLHRDEFDHRQYGQDVERSMLDQLRSRASVEFEQRLGYRWTGYRRSVSWDSTTQLWCNELSLEIEALRSGIRVVEYDYVGPKFVIIGAPMIDQVNRQTDSKPSYLSSVDSGFHTDGYKRARFDVGRELFADERITLTWAYHFPDHNDPDVSFGLTTPFDRMEFIELVVTPQQSQRSFVFTYCDFHLGSIVVRRWNSGVPEDRLVTGDHAGVFTVRYSRPSVGVTYSIELVELDNIDIRKTLAKPK